MLLEVRGNAEAFDSIATSLPQILGRAASRLIHTLIQQRLSLLIAEKAVSRGDVTYAAGCCFRSVACMNQVLFGLNQEYLLNEKGEIAVAERFPRCPQNYQERVESAFALLSNDAKSLTDGVAILDRIEQDLNQWYGDRRLA